MSILKSCPPFSLSPGHVIGGGSWWVWRFNLAGPNVGDPPLCGGGGVTLVLPSCWLPPPQGIIVFCLVLLN
jgi:hypothetical protein